MSGSPIGFPGIVESEAEQERLQPQLGGLERDPRRVASTAQIADRLVVDGRHVHRSQVSRAQQTRELHGITPIGLDLVAGSFGNQRWSDHLTLESFSRQVTVQPVTAGSGLVGEHQARGLALKPLRQLHEIAFAGADGADEMRGLRAERQGVGYCDRILVHIETDEKRSRLLHG